MYDVVWCGVVKQCVRLMRRYDDGKTNPNQHIYVEYSMPKLRNGARTVQIATLCMQN